MKLANLIEKHRLLSAKVFSPYQVDRILKDIFPDLTGEPHMLIISKSLPEYDSDYDKPGSNEIYSNEYCSVRYIHKEDSYSTSINWSGLLNLIQYFSTKHVTVYGDLVKISAYYRNNYLSLPQAEKLVAEITGCIFSQH